MLTIFLDMDDVLTDFDGQYERHFGMPCEETWAIDKAKAALSGHPDPARAANDAFRDRILSVPDFWGGMDKMPYADELVETAFAVTKDVRVLTAVLDYDSARSVEQKTEWLTAKYKRLSKRAIFARTIVNADGTVGSDKWRWCMSPHDFLVDDNEGNVRRWRYRGGSAFALPRWLSAERDFLVDLEWSARNAATSPRVSARNFKDVLTEGL